MAAAPGQLAGAKVRLVGHPAQSAARVEPALSACVPLELFPPFIRLIELQAIVVHDLVTVIRVLERLASLLVDVRDRRLKAGGATGAESWRIMPQGSRQASSSGPQHHDVTRSVRQRRR